jgi:hypothetical protein
MTGGLLQVFAFGAGAFSLDGRRRGMTHAPELLDVHLHEMTGDFRTWCALYAAAAVIE